MSPRLKAAAVALVVILLPLSLRADDYDWGTWHVALQEDWPAHAAGLPPLLEPGIVFWRRDAGAESSISDMRNGWVSDRNEGPGVTVLLGGNFKATQRIEIRSFVRKGDRVHLAVVAHRGGGKPPEWLTDAVRRKSKMAAGAPIADADLDRLAEKRVLVAAEFPSDLPPGSYHVTVECRDPEGAVLERFERPFVRPPDRPDPLLGLTDDQVIQAYVERGLALRGMSVEPLDSRLGRMAAAFPYEHPKRLAWADVHREIVRRGKPMVPALIDLLEAEAARNPGAGSWDKAQFGLSSDVMNMLARIGDPRPVDLLVRIIAGLNDRTNLLVRQRAVETIRTLTHTEFLVDAENPPPSDASIGAGAIVFHTRGSPQTAQTYNAVAELYRQWLANEGRDPARWLPLATARAREALKADDATAVRWAVTFLAGAHWHRGFDDDPERTMPLLASLLDTARQSVVTKISSFVRIPSALAAYGPVARPYVESMIELAKAKPTWDGFANLAAVGGERAMAYLIETLPALRSELTRHDVDVDTDKDRLSNMEAREAMLAYKGCRWAIERCAARTFATDEQIGAWWTHARSSTQRQWIEQSLDHTAAEADAGNAKAQFILRQVLPDLPYADADRPFDPPWSKRMTITYLERERPAFRAAWVEQNRSKFRYDEKRSCFVMAAERQ
ncbi:MAG TPA: hypothetical protein VF624_18745 [Tepidisphaeraceae bacterium]